MVAERLMLAGFVVVWAAVALSLGVIIFVIIHNHRERKRHDRETAHERLTDDIN